MTSDDLQIDPIRPSLTAIEDLEKTMRFAALACTQRPDDTTTILDFLELSTSEFCAQFCVRNMPAILYVSEQMASIIDPSLRQYAQLFEDCYHEGMSNEPKELPESDVPRLMIGHCMTSMITHAKGEVLDGAQRIREICLPADKRPRAPFVDDITLQLQAKPERT
ncbi:MAG: hypothetical protein JNL58_31515 [Planctomyces sp.]|nr:hypothetical protein [Planctomyces sp.]